MNTLPNNNLKCCSPGHASAASARSGTSSEQQLLLVLSSACAFGFAIAKHRRHSHIRSEQTFQHVFNKPHECSRSGIEGSRFLVVASVSAARTPEPLRGPQVSASGPLREHIRGLHSDLLITIYGRKRNKNPLQTKGINIKEQFFIRLNRRF